MNDATQQPASASEVHDDGIIIRPGFFPALVAFCLANPFIVLLLTALLVMFGLAAVRQLKLDALPDLSDNQVIVMADWMGRSPELIDNQVAYPLSTQLAALPHVRDIRTMSSFGLSMLYIIFDDDVDIYWARTRVAERLDIARSQLPPDAMVRLGPEGTGVGHVYWYLVENSPDPQAPKHDLAELRSLQDWYIRYQLTTVPGVAEVASGGGFTREYHVDLDPVALRRYMLMPEQVRAAIAASNMDVGGRNLEESDTEIYVRSRGYLGSAAGGHAPSAGTDEQQSAVRRPPSAEQLGGTSTEPDPGPRTSERVLDDLRQVVVAHDAAGTPVPLSAVATVQLGSAQRRGVLDHNGAGEAVTGIVVMRYGGNADEVIRLVKAKLDEVRRGLPPGVVISTAHDRSWLIERSIDTVRHSLYEEGIVVVLIVLLFLLNLRPSAVVIVTLPIAVLAGFIGMYLLHITSNIMSLGGVAIAIGVIVDDGIVMTENVHRHLAGLWTRAVAAGRRPAPAEISRAILRGSQQVAKPAFVTTLIIITSFLPVFFLTGQEGKLFGPLAWTKSLVMLASAVLCVTLVPVLMQLLLRTRMLPEESNPLTRLLNALYAGPLRFALELRWLTLLVALGALLLTWPVYRSIGQEFMPNLNEGELVYMPTTGPGVTVSEAKRLLQLTDKVMLQHPLVVNVVGKAGRADTATDPAPLSMIETFVQFAQVEPAARLPQWQPGDERRALLVRPRWRWADGLGALLHPPAGQLYSGKPGYWQPLDAKYAHYTISDIRNDLDGMLSVPGLTNGWTMPIINRIQMLATGVRTDLGIKIYGDDMDRLTALARQAGEIARTVPGVKDVFAEQLSGGHYLDIVPDRRACARYGLNVGDVQGMVEMLLGGMPVTTTVEKRARYAVQLRYAADYRDTPAAVGRMLIDTPHQGPVPLSAVARVGYSAGPSELAAENGLIRSVVFANVRDRPMVETVEDLTRALSAGLKLPPGYYFRIAGQWEHITRARTRLLLIMPVVLVIIFAFLYLTFGDMTDALLVFVSLPFAFVGGVWAVKLLHFNFSVAVWVGFIALFGTAVNTGVLMMVYLQEALDRRLAKGWLRPGDVYSATVEGAVKRLRPKLMTVATALLGLIPLLWATGIGSDVMKPVAAPLIGGLASSTVMVLFVIPVLFYWVRSAQLRKLVRG
jgi:Cu(I)/Ag(I) efflux system membrane protein CusA/SilA